MKRLTIIRSNFLGIFTALLILSQSFFAAGQPVSFISADDAMSKTELNQQFSDQACYVDATTRITVAAFPCYWFAKVFSLLSIPVIQYKNCQAFLVNAYASNVYYAHLRALAP